MGLIFILKRNTIVTKKILISKRTIDNIFRKEL